MILTGNLINFNVLDKNFQGSLFSIFSLGPAAFNLIYKMTNATRRWDLTKGFLDSKER